VDYCVEIKERVTFFGAVFFSVIDTSLRKFMKILLDFNPLFLYNRNGFL